jgi:hypothetical protein
LQLAQLTPLLWVVEVVVEQVMDLAQTPDQMDLTPLHFP